MTSLDIKPDSRDKIIGPEDEFDYIRFLDFVNTDWIYFLKRQKVVIKEIRIYDTHVTKRDFQLSEIEVWVENKLTPEFAQFLEDMGVKKLTLNCREHEITTLPRNIIELRIEGSIRPELICKSRQPQLRVFSGELNLVNTIQNDDPTTLDLTQIKHLNIWSCNYGAPDNYLVKIEIAPKIFSTMDNCSNNFKFHRCVIQSFRCETADWLSALKKCTVDHLAIYPKYFDCYNIIDFNSNDGRWILRAVEFLEIKNFLIIPPHEIKVDSSFYPRNYSPERSLGFVPHVPYRLRKFGLIIGEYYDYRGLVAAVERLKIKEFSIKSVYEENIPTLDIRCDVIEVVCRHLEFYVGDHHTGWVKFFTNVLKRNPEIHIDTKFITNNRKQPFKYIQEVIQAANVDLNKVSGSLFAQVQQPLILEIIERQLIPVLAEIVVNYL